MTQARYSPDHAETDASALTDAPARRPGRPWTAPPAAGALRSTVTVPGSKSLTNRELLLAAIADAPSRLTAPLHSDDSAGMVEALRALGADIRATAGRGPFGDDIIVNPIWPLAAGTTIDCGQAGTVMRFIAPILGFAHGEVTLTAHESALHRPMGEMIKAL